MRLIYNHQNLILNIRRKRHLKNVKAMLRLISLWGSHLRPYRKNQFGNHLLLQSNLTIRYLACCKVKDAKKRTTYLFFSPFSTILSSKVPSPLPPLNVFIAQIYWTFSFHFPVRLCCFFFVFFVCFFGISPISFIVNMVAYYFTFSLM